MLGQTIGYGGDAAPMGGAVEGQRILSSRTPRQAVAMYVVTAVTTFTCVLLVSVPASNQRFREITFNIIASQAEGEVKPRVFYERFPNIDLYVREIPQSGGWNGVFMSDNRSGDGSTIYVIEPHGNPSPTVFADAPLAFDPVSVVMDSAQTYPTDDRQQILAFSPSGAITLNRCEGGLPSSVGDATQARY